MTLKCITDIKILKKKIKKKLKYRLLLSGNDKEDKREEKWHQTLPMHELMSQIQEYVLCHKGLIDKSVWESLHTCYILDLVNILAFCGQIFCITTSVSQYHMKYSLNEFWRLAFR